MMIKKIIEERKLENQKNDQSGMEHGFNIIMCNYYATQKLLRENQVAYLHNLKISLDNLCFLADSTGQRNEEYLKIIKEETDNLVKKQNCFIKDISDLYKKYYLSLDKNNYTSIETILNKSVETFDNFDIFCDVNVYYLHLIIELVYEEHEKYNIDLVDFLYKIRESLTEKMIEKNPKIQNTINLIVGRLLLNEDLYIQQQLAEEGLYFLSKFPSLCKEAELLLKTFIFRNKEKININSWSTIISYAEELLARLEKTKKK